MKLHVIYRIEMPTPREAASRGVTCAHVPLFACSWRWVTKLVALFTKHDFIAEAFEDETPQREGVCDDTTGFKLWGKERGQRWYKPE